MAARRAAQAVPIKDEGTPGQLTVRIVLEADDSMEPIYVNYAEVAQGQYESEISFSRTPARIAADRVAALQKGEAITIYPSVKLLLPTAFLPKLADALAAVIALQNREENNEHHGVATAKEDVKLSKGGQAAESGGRSVRNGGSKAKRG